MSYPVKRLLSRTPKGVATLMMSGALFVGAWGCESTPNYTDAGPMGSPDPADARTPDASPPDAEMSDMGLDAAPTMEDAEILPDAELHELTEVTVSGQVELGFGGVGGQVTVTGKCGDKEISTVSDVEGRYSVTADVEDCPLLVISFEKESYVPTYRAIPLPPPTSPVTLSVSLLSNRALECGPEICSSGPNDEDITADPVRRGWVYYDDGLTAVDQVAGEFATDDGDLLWVTSYAYYELFDDTGNIIDAMTPKPICLSVVRGSLTQLVDADPGTDQVEVMSYSFNAVQATWTQQDAPGVLSRREAVSGGYVFTPITRAELGDVRRGEGNQTPWICGQVAGSGWTVYGRPIAEKSCISIKAHDQCGHPVPNVTAELTSRDEGYRALRWSDRQGDVCVVGATSEPVGVDQDGDEQGGETHFVELELRHEQRSRAYDALEMPRTEGSCDAPESCLQIDYEINLPGADCP